MKKFFKLIIAWLLVIGTTYLFLSLCNWSIKVPEWNGFSRFIIGAEGMIFLVNLFNES